MKATAVSILIFLLPTVLWAQLSKQRSWQNDFLFRVRPQLDSGMDINRLSRESCHRLIDKMFTIDQQYRNSSMRYELHTEKERYFTGLTNQNDLVNWTLLLKIVKRHGWPCQANGERSYKAWIIAWHARADWKWVQRFYPHVKKGYQLHCVHPNLYREFKDLFNHLNKIFNPT